MPTHNYFLMKRLLFFLSLSFLIGCSEGKNEKQILLKERKNFEQDNVFSLRYFDGVVGFCGENGLFGMIDLQTITMKKTQIEMNSEKEISKHFKQILNTKTDFYLVSLGRIFKTEMGGMQLVYEDDKNRLCDVVFQDEKNGIALLNNNLFFSFLETTNQGKTWQENSLQIHKKESEYLLMNEVIWPVKNGFRFVSSGENVKMYEVENQKVIQKKLPFTNGILALRYFDENQAVVINKSEEKTNVAFTFNGGNSWEVLQTEIGKPHAVAYVPESNGNEMLISSETGIWYSSNKGEKWEKVSKEILYTFTLSSEYLVGTNLKSVKIFQISEKK